MKYKVNKIFILFTVVAMTFFGCEVPLSANKTIPIKVELPSWTTLQNYPELDFWKIVVTTENKKHSFNVAKDKIFFELTLQEFSFAAIECFPITKSVAKDFFCPASTIYPFCFQNKNSCADWQNYALAKTFRLVLEHKNNDKKFLALNYFNWHKLQETLLKKDNDSFEKYSLKTKTCTTSFHTNFESLLERILNPPTRFSVPYNNTSCLILADKFKEYQNENFLCPYIPLNNFNKEKGCLTIQTKPNLFKTTFLLNEKPIYIQNKKLYFE